MLELSNFKRAPKIEFSNVQPGALNFENSKSDQPDHSGAHRKFANIL
jgi:hypothetical protein